MKKIKFRGKRKDNEEWVYGYPIVLKSPIGEKNCFILREDFEIDWAGDYPGTQLLENFIEVIPETVGQYIEIDDLHGKEMFEGDIIKLYQPDGKTFSEVPTAYIFYEKGAWRVSGFDKFPYISDILSSLELKFEVIGNIHDNPEVLPTKKDD